MFACPCARPADSFPLCSDCSLGSTIAFKPLVVVARGRAVCLSARSGWTEDAQLSPCGSVTLAFYWPGPAFRSGPLLAVSRRPIPTLRPAARKNISPPRSRLYASSASSSSTGLGDEHSWRHGALSEQVYGRQGVSASAGARISSSTRCGPLAERWRGCRLQRVGSRTSAELPRSTRAPCRSSRACRCCAGGGGCVSARSRRCGSNCAPATMRPRCAASKHKSAWRTPHLRGMDQGHRRALGGMEEAGR